MIDETLPKMLRRKAQETPDIAMQIFRQGRDSYSSVSYSEVFQIALDFGAGLLDIGACRGSRIGMISDNRKEWAQADFGIMSIGAADIPRGCDATDDDLTYILSFAECEISIAENQTQAKRLASLSKNIPSLKTMIAFDFDEETRAACGDVGLKSFSFDEILERGKNFRKANPGAVEAELEKGRRDDVASIIFTSGTTGIPKGVILLHKNFLSQLDDIIKNRVVFSHGEKSLCVLPVWHSFERECEYVVWSQNATLCYSRPIGKVMLDDFKNLNPQVLYVVPRIIEGLYDGIMRTTRKKGGIAAAAFGFFTGAAVWFSRFKRKALCQEAQWKKPSFARFFLLIPAAALWPAKALGDILVFKKIRAMFGKNFRRIVVGGGAFPRHIDEFFLAIGMDAVEGYGLSENAPIVAVRSLKNPIFATIGKPLSCVSAKILDDEGRELPAGKTGSLFIKGDSVMKGYYKRDDLTRAVMSEDGWLDTGDLAAWTFFGELALRGRKKDTIVLSGGENIEPQAIELRLAKSRYISQSVVIGTDEQGTDMRFLSALIVPVEDEIKTFAKENSIEFAEYAGLLRDERVLSLIKGEISREISAKNGFRPFEQIQKFRIIAKPFEAGRELSAKLEVKRFKIRELYADEIRSIYHDGQAEK